MISSYCALHAGQFKLRFGQFLQPDQDTCRRIIARPGVAITDRLAGHTFAHEPEQCWRWAVYLPAHAPWQAGDLAADLVSQTLDTAELATGDGRSYQARLDGLHRPKLCWRAFWSSGNHPLTTHQA